MSTHNPWNASSTVVATGLAVALVLGLSLPSTEAAAETFCGASSAPRPVEETSAVRLVSQYVQFDKVEGAFRPEGRDNRFTEEYWRVRSAFELENVTDEPVELTVAFVDNSDSVHDTCDHCECSDDPLVVVVDGEPRALDVPERLGARVSWAEPDYEVATVDLNFAAGGSRTLAREYIFGGPETAVYVGSERIHFDAVPGAAWEGPVAESRFVVELPTRPERIRYSSGFERPPKPPAEPKLEVRRYAESIEDGRRRTTFVVGADDWEPTSGVSFYLQHYMQSGPDCPEDEQTWRDARDDGRDEEAEAILAEKAESYSAEKLRYCRNLPYARHGYDFESDELDDTFYGSDDTPYIYMTDVVVRFRKNPEFTEALLTPDEIAYAEYIRAIETYKREHPPTDDDSTTEQN